MFRQTSAWEGEPPEPNPVAQIIGVRTAQTSGAALAALAGLRYALPEALCWPVLVGGGMLVAGGLSAYFMATFTAALPLPGAPLLVRLPPTMGADAVALTFDDGPHPETTPRLLDTLGAAGARATFFLIGERASRYPALARRIAEEGHGIGVHGLRHRTMALDSAKQIERDLGEAARRIEDALQGALPERLFRPPYGFKSLTLCRTAARTGWHLVAWSLDGRDYDPHTPESLTKRVRDRLTPGDIVLLHERPNAPATLEALPRILSTLRERSLRTVSLAIAVHHE